MSNSFTAVAPSPSCCNPPLSANPNPNSRSPWPKRAIRYPLGSSSKLGRAIFAESAWRPSRTRCLPSRLSCSLDLPLLPFDSDEVLIPSELKTLHLYEARFLALLEESLQKRKKFFVHIVLDPVLAARSSMRASFAARYGCLVIVEKVERLTIGALVSIRGVGRVSVVNVIQTEPYLRGTVIPMQDNAPNNETETNSKVIELKENLNNLHSLQIKLKTSKNELLQTRIKNAVTWAESEDHQDCDQTFLPEFAERLSFAALQPVSGSSSSEVLDLQREKLQAMKLRDTSERLERGIKIIKHNIAVVVAKLAIQSLEM